MILLYNIAMITDGQQFRGFSPESYATALQAGAAYFQGFEQHTCAWAVAAAQPLTADPDIMVPALTLGIQRHFPLRPGQKYNPPQRIEDLSHVIDFAEWEAPRLVPDKSRYTGPLMAKTGWLLKLMGQTGERMGHPIVSAWGVNLDTSEPFIRVDAVAPGGASADELVREAAERHDAAFEDDHLVFEYGAPELLDSFIERRGGPVQNPRQVYAVHYGFDPLQGAALRAEYNL